MVIAASAFPGANAQEVKDPVKEATRQRVKQLTTQNYKDLKDAADQLLAVSKELNDEVGKSGEHVISAAIFDKLDKIDKLSRKIRDKAKGVY